MGKFVLVCPFCQKKLETTDSNVGRDGQCPACEKIFEITEPARFGAAGAAAGARVSREYEYEDSNTLVVTVATAVGLLLLIGSTALQWAPPLSKVTGYLTGVRLTVVAVSLACFGFFVFSAVGRKSLMPAAIVTGAWGTVVTIWTWGIWFFVHGAVGQMAEVAKKDFALSGGLFATLAAAVIVIVGLMAVYAQSKGSSTFDRFGFFMVVGVLVGLILGMAVVAAHVRPAVSRLASTAQQDEPGQPGAASSSPPRTSQPPSERPDRQPQRRDVPPAEQAVPPAEQSGPPPADDEPQAPDPNAVPFEAADDDGRGDDY